MRPIPWVRRLLGHTRLVPSGSPPLYRLCLVGLIISALIQLVTGEVPDSIATTTPQWFDMVWASLQGVAALVTLGSLYVTASSSRHAEHLHRSLSYEWFGLVLLVTVVLTSFIGAWLWGHQVPRAGSSWVQGAFGLWILRTRLPEITQALRELQKNEH